jgi:hypothetical protein
VGAELEPCAIFFSPNALFVSAGEIALIKAVSPALTPYKKQY